MIHLDDGIKLSNEDMTIVNIAHNATSSIVKMVDNDIIAELLARLFTGAAVSLLAGIQRNNDTLCNEVDANAFTIEVTNIIKELINKKIEEII